MRSTLLASAAAIAMMTPIAWADMQGTGEAGGWERRVAVKPDPSKVVVPPGYEVGIFVQGLDTPSSATVDADGNLWVAISGSLFGGSIHRQAPRQGVRQIRQAAQRNRQGHLQHGHERDRLLPENGKTYIPEYGEKIWEIDGVDGELSLIIKDLFIGDHRNGGITCKDGFLYFALGLPSNTGFADPDNHGWTDIPSDPYWVKHDDGHGTTPRDPVCREIIHTGLNVRSTDGRLTGVCYRRA